MRLRLSVALPLALLLGACDGGTGNEAGSDESPEGGVTVPINNGGRSAPPGDVPPPNGTDRPKPAAEVTLTVSPEQTTEDSTVTLTLRNGSEEQVGYNLCTSALQTEGGREVPTSRICTMELRTLEPGRTTTYRYELPVNMAKGGYRLLTQVHWMGSDRTSGITSNGFAVRSD